MAQSAKITSLHAATPVVRKNRLTDLSAFSDEEHQFIEQTFEDFRLRRNSRGQRAKYEGQVIDTVRDYFAFFGLGPWNWTEFSFDEWNDYLVRQRRAKRTTQSTYQNHFRAYQGFIVENSVIQQRCQVVFGCRIERIATRYNCITHKTNAGSATKRRNFTSDEQAAFCRAIRDEYEFKKQSASKGLFAAGRDLAMFGLIFDAGLRIDECLSIRWEHFDHHPDRPECGRFGKVMVWGKASAGNPKPKRTIPITDAKIAKLLAWYETYIRSRVLHRCDAQETAFWLSERGRALGYGSAWERFHKYKVEANLGNEDGLTIHSMRHSSVDRDLSKGTPAVAVQRKHGHTSLGTTGGYCHTTDQYVEESYGQTAMRRRREMLQGSSNDSKRNK